MQVSQHHATDHGVKAGATWEAGDGFSAEWKWTESGQDDVPDAVRLIVTGTDGYDARQIKVAFTLAEALEFVGALGRILFTLEAGG